KNPYNVALLDGDLLIITPPTYDLPESSSYTNAVKDNVSSSSNTLVQSILDRMYRRESELPYLFLQWAD
ncbi:MAG: hypothetical protein JWO03_1796, partial [Bacteroidetes bacterium]|nr:hypothetical protein [Bacteroidota bacterium]